MESITITVDESVARELQYLVDLHQQHGAPNPVENVEQLVAFVLASVADGSRRPGSWERSMLDSMGLVADTDEHQQYRAAYGPPEDSVGAPSP